MSCFKDECLPRSNFTSYTFSFPYKLFSFLFCSQWWVWAKRRIRRKRRWIIGLRWRFRRCRRRTGLSSSCRNPTYPETYSKLLEEDRLHAWSRLWLAKSPKGISNYNLTCAILLLSAPSCIVCLSWYHASLCQRYRYGRSRNQMNFGYICFRQGTNLLFWGFWRCWYNTLQFWNT